uniref:Calnexin n=1 Tax=Monodelphis domestica TaxID=13616 RepID=F6W8I1_MONDO
MTLLLLETVVQARDEHDDGDDDGDGDGDDGDDDEEEEDNDVIDVEDLEDGIKEEEDSKPGDGATLSPSPKVTYKAPVPTGDVYFVDAFNKGMLVGWVLSKAKKDNTDDEIVKYDGKWEVEEMKESKLPGDKGLVLLSRAKHHAISARLNKPFTFDTNPLIAQYEVNFQSGIECGGAYVKLLSRTPELNLDQFHYTIMFGADKSADGAAESVVMGQMLEAAEERPCLWVVYILTMALSQEDENRKPKAEKDEILNTSPRNRKP